MRGKKENRREKGCHERSNGEHTDIGIQKRNKGEKNEEGSTVQSNVKQFDYEP